MAKIELNIKQDEQINLDAHQLKHYADIVDIQTWEELLNSYLALKEELQPKKVFLVLENNHQAEYTSMHAVQDDRLYFDIHEYLHNIDVNDPKWEQTYQNVCIPKQLQHYIQQLNHIDNQHSFDGLTEKMQCYDEDDLQVILSFNRDPLTVMDKDITVKIANVETDSLKLAMMPNGYFSCDFNPFENFAIIQRMQQYGFEFMGLGAALIGLIKRADFQDEKIEDLMRDLALIYPLTASHQTELKVLVLKNNYLILPYSESPQEYMDYYL